ncbi:MAG: hypothetical protein JW776_14160 [Candidatus Lokiarchaeota archaeon]|nr:hypothetical protein [Candidatus Lokiarchaeota archaeon]
MSLDSDNSPFSPYSAVLARMGRKMRMYGNTLLVIMIVNFLTSIFIFDIIVNPITAAMIILYIFAIVEILYLIDFLSALKRSETEYGGFFLRQAYFALLGMLILQSIVVLTGTIVVIVKYEELSGQFSAGNSLTTIFYTYNLLNTAAFWIKLIEIAIPSLGIVGYILLRKWGINFVGDRLEEEAQAPFPKEMRLMVYGAILYIFYLVVGLFLGFIPLGPSYYTSFQLMINVIRLIGNILTALGFSRGGYYLELYTTEDKKKFFSSQTYEDDE